MSTTSTSLVETTQAQEERERRTLDSIAATFRNPLSPSQPPASRTLTALAQADRDGLLPAGKPRSLLWKIYFGQIPPPESHRGHDPLASEPLASSPSGQGVAHDHPYKAWLTRCGFLLQEERRAYHAQKRASQLTKALRAAQEALLDPHPEEEEECEEDAQEANPDLELLKSIGKDVQRTFPEIDLFSAQEADDEDEENAGSSQLAEEEEDYRRAVRAQLTAMLFVWCTLHPDVGYRQGIHELAAACYYVRWHDRLRAIASGDALNGMVRTLLNEEEVEADAYALFNAIMNGMKRWYEWRDSSSTSTGSTPILAKAAAVMTLLAQADPPLAKHLNKVGVEPQLFVLRWVRLLFTREFPLNQALLLWDGLFAHDALEASRTGTFNVIARDGGNPPRRRTAPENEPEQGHGQEMGEPEQEGNNKLGLLDAICVTMLMRIRAYMLDEDYTQVITQLLRYPSLDQIATLASQDDDGPEANAVSLFVKQATRIHAQPNRSTAAEVMRENRELLGVPANFERPAAARPPSVRPAAPARPGFVLPEGITDLARGLYDRSESLGLQKAVGSAVANMQRTVSAYAQQAGHAGIPRRRMGNDGFPSAWEGVVPASHRARQLLQSHSGPRSPSGEPPSLHMGRRKDQERNRMMGVAMGGCIEALEAKWKSPAANMDALTSDDMASLMAITTLKHIRDVLLAEDSTYNPAILAPWLTRAEPKAKPESDPAPDLQAAPTEQAPSTEGEPSAPSDLLPLTPAPASTDPVHPPLPRAHSGPVRRTKHMFSSVSPSPGSVVYPIRGLHVSDPSPAQGRGQDDRATSISDPLTEAGVAPVRSDLSGRTSFGSQRRLPLHERLAAVASHHGSSHPASSSGELSAAPGPGTPSSTTPAPDPLAKTSSDRGRQGQMAAVVDDPLGAL